MVDTQKILAMLEVEDKPFAQKARGCVAKESLVKASGGDYDAINSLLEEDIALDERAYAPKQRIVAGKPAAESINAKECDGAVAITPANPIPSPVEKKRSQKPSRESVKDGNFKYRGAEMCKTNGKWMIQGFGESYNTLEEAMAQVDEDIENGGIDYSMSVDDEIDLASASESVTEESKMIGTTGGEGGNPENKINFKSQNNGFETDEDIITGDAKAMNEKETVKAAGEELIETKSADSVFPEEMDFDEEAFAELFGLNADEVSAQYVPEDENEPEHLEIRFKEGENEVLLKVKDNGEVEEVVNAEVAETPRFAISISPDEDGRYQLLISGANESEAVMSEEDGTNQSEGDVDSEDENGDERTDEFVEGAGLDLDSEYSESHGMKPAKNAADKIKAYEGTQLKPVRKK